MTPSAQDAGTPSDRRELLQFVVETHRDEMERHEEEMGKTFNWTLTILLALGAAMLGFAGSTGWGRLPVHWPLQLTVSLTSVLIASVASVEMVRRVRAYDINARVVAHASALLHLFEPNYFSPQHPPLYPARWKNWGDPTYPATKDVPSFNVVVLMAVAVGNIALTWLL
jgi:hypothetical protein